MKTPLFFIVAEQTRRHLGQAPSEVKKTLRNRMIGTYGVGLLNVIILAVTATIAILGSTSFIKPWSPVLAPAVAVAGVIALFGFRAHFDSLGNPGVTEFDQRFGLASLSPFRRGRSPK